MHVQIYKKLPSGCIILLFYQQCMGASVVLYVYQLLICHLKSILAMYIGIERYFIGVFTYFSMKTNEIDLLMCSFAHHIVSFVKCLFKCFALVCKIACLYHWDLSVLYICWLWIPLSDIYSANIFSNMWLVFSLS